MRYPMRFLGPRAALLTLALVLLTARAASAAAISETFRYDGTYDPYTATPPSGQSTWTALSVVPHGAGLRQY